MSLLDVVRLRLWGLFGYLLLKKVQEGQRRIDLCAVLVGKVEGVLNDAPHCFRVASPYIWGQQISILVVNNGSRVAISDSGSRLPGKVHDGVVFRSMDPIGANVYQVAIGKSLLVQPASESIPGLKDCDTEAGAKENIRTAEASKASANYTNMNLPSWIECFRLRKVVS